MLRILNLALLVLFPISWAAPLMRAGLLPLFGLSEVSVLSGLATLWHSDIVLALLVAFFALFAPICKTILIALIHFGRASENLLKPLTILGKFAMADVFLIAIYIVLVKGIGLGHVQTAWGLYLFTACIFASLIISHLTRRP
ncbi:paraquat-inducible protein A [Cognatishimia sp. SS12]|uniref:paraquat-inducible protein A n=1 Tax=Cognatishimia sp. SS12 TaxID=2979465 RepID=UPI00232FC8FC|nr:paraquat-inducible protein A [Cognatishimia sp. SS12]MDC0737400.1 paraquat-inducible protein A [Cognatishimia sp. SS12]